MPPKKSATAEDGAGLTEQQQSAQNEHISLLNKAVNSKILCSPGTAPQAECLRPSKALLKCNGKDIVKKSSTRKNRYLLLFNARIAPAKGGTLGTLAKLDTKNPILYMDFPNGRLKFFGTLVFPKNKYMVLKASGSSDVVCEDVFENMVVFSEAWWIGTAEENPEEKKLAFPDSVLANKVHEGYDYGFGASDFDRKEVPKAAGGSRSKPAEKRERPEDDDGQDVDLVDDSDDDEMLTARTKRRRTATEKPPTLEEGTQAKEEVDASMLHAAQQLEDHAEVPHEEHKKNMTKRDRQQTNGDTPEETPKRRVSLRLEGATKNYAEDSNEEQKDDLDTGGHKDNVGVDEDAADDKRDDKTQLKNSRSSSRATKLSASQQHHANGQVGAGASKRAGRGRLAEDDGSLIVLDSSDGETPIKPPRPSRTPQKTPARKAQNPTRGSQPETIELLDTPVKDTPDQKNLKDTPSQRVLRATPTRRLAALKQSGAVMEAEEKSQEAEGEAEDADSGSEDEEDEEQDEEEDKDNDDNDDDDADTAQDDDSDSDYSG